MRFYLLFPFFLIASVTYAKSVKILEPKSGFINKQTINIRGTTQPGVNRATVIVNGIAQDVLVSNGAFSIRAVVAPGNNLIELMSLNEKDSVSFYSGATKRDIKIILNWDEARYVDLWVTDPHGEKCFYGHTSTKAGGNFTANDETSFGPQIYTLAKAIPGTYSIDAQYYSPGNAPISRVFIYVVLHEGTPKEMVSSFRFVMTKAGDVYHITSFTIHPED